VRFGRPFRLADAHEDGSRVRHQEAADAIMLAVAELAPPELRGEFADLDGLRMRLGGLYRPA
jgi:hypothetical protein